MVDRVERFRDRRPRTAWLIELLLAGIGSVIALWAIGTLLLIALEGLTR